TEAGSTRDGWAEAAVSENGRGQAQLLWYCAKLVRTYMRKAEAAHVLLCLLASTIWITAAEQLKPGASRTAIPSYLNRTADAVLALKSTRFSITREGTPAVL